MHFCSSSALDVLEVLLVVKIHCIDTGDFTVFLGLPDPSFWFSTYGVSNHSPYVDGTLGKPPGASRLDNQTCGY